MTNIASAPPALVLDSGNIFDIQGQTNLMVNQWLALGTADAITITGGSIIGTTIGVTDPEFGGFDGLTAIGTVDLHGATMDFNVGQLTPFISGTTLTDMIITLHSGEPTSSTHAAPKSYVDTAVSGITLTTWATL